MKHKFQQFIKRHHPHCKSHEFSGDRHCSCGRNEMETVYESALLLCTAARSALHSIDNENAYETLLMQIEQFENLTQKDIKFPKIEA